MIPASDPHVFISHAWKDGTVHAQRLYEALTKRGISAWLDLTHMNPFNDFTGEIDLQIKRASHVVVCVTPDIDREDSYVRLEIGYAKGHRKPIIAALFEDVVPPSPIVNHTRAYFNRNWDGAFAQVLDYLSKPREYESPAADPFQVYLDALRQEIEDYLKIAIIREIPLHSRETPGAVQTTATKRMLGSLFATTVRVNPEEKKPLLAFDSLGDAFKHFGGRLLLLGEPGAGKTITLMTFVRAMVASRLADRNKPLPIFARVADWDGKTRLVDWLAGQVPIKRDDLAALIEGGKALLALDGLDELGGEREDPETKERIPDQRPQFLSLLPPNNQIIVSCRVKDYNEIGQKATLTGAVTLQPLDDRQMDDYLSEQPDLWAVLQADDDLRDVARTPLLLSEFAYAFNGLDEEAKKLHSFRRGDLRDMIFETYVRRRYEHETLKPYANIPFTIDEIYKVLGNLALDSLSVLSVTTLGHNLFDLIRDSLDEASYDFGVSSKQLHLEVPSSDETPNNFIELVTRLHLSLPSSVEIRFVHILLRDYFAFNVVRESAIWYLSWLSDDRAARMLIDALGDPKTDVRVQAKAGLLRLGDGIIDVLLEEIQNSEPRRQRNALDILFELGSPKAVNALVKLSQEGDKELAELIGLIMLLMTPHPPRIKIHRKKR
jgi:hypothetical protein